MSGRSHKGENIHRKVQVSECISAQLDATAKIHI